MNLPRRSENLDSVIEAKKPELEELKSRKERIEEVLA